ncbi:MAG: glycosyltransferase family 4 protein [Microbacterium sp.]
MSKKVLLIAPACDGEDVGEAWVAAQWAQRLAKSDELTLLTMYKRGHTPMSRQLPGARVIEWAEPPGVGRFERFNSLLFPGYWPFHRLARRWIRRALAAGEHFDVAHQVAPIAMRYPSPAAGLGIPFIMGPVGGSLTSPPGFASEEGATSWYQRLRALDSWRMRNDRWLRRTYESADVVVGVADYVRDFLADVRLRRFEVMSETAVIEVPEPVDRTARTGPIRLLHVGRTVRTKGLRDVIRAMDAIRDLDVVLDVLGDGNDRPACEALIAQLGLGERITLHGAVPRATVDDFYRNADVFVFPSYREPGGNVSLEAMSWGLPVIVCRVGGPGANVNDDSGIRLDARDPDQLAADCAAALRLLISNRARRLAMGEAGREHVLRSHQWSHRVAQMDRIYEEIMVR